MDKRNELIPFVVKLTPEQRAELQLRANQFTNGNLSAWMRRAAGEYNPEEVTNGQPQKQSSRAAARKKID